VVRESARSIARTRFVKALRILVESAPVTNSRNDDLRRHLTGLEQHDGVLAGKRDFTVEPRKVNCLLAKVDP